MQILYFHRSTEHTLHKLKSEIHVGLAGANLAIFYIK